MTTENPIKRGEQREIGGVLFEAVRYELPRSHWRACVVETGFIFQAGCFNSKSKPKLWASLEDTARRRGDSWKEESLTAHIDVVDRRPPKEGGIIYRARYVGLPGVEPPVDLPKRETQTCATNKACMEHLGRVPAIGEEFRFPFYKPEIRCKRVA